MSTDAVQRTDAAANFDQELITRYTFAERINHWIGALTYIYLLITGLAFWSPYLYWLAAVVGGGPTARFAHPWVGLLFTASYFWTCIEWYRDMHIDAEDREWAHEIKNYINNEDDKLPPVGRFNWGQKLFFWGMFWSTILLLLSGFGLWFTDTSRAPGPGRFIANGITRSRALRGLNSDPSAVGPAHSPRQRLNFRVSVRRRRSALLRESRNISERPLCGNREGPGGLPENCRRSPAA